MFEFKKKIIIVGLVLILGLMLVGCSKELTEIKEKQNMGRLKVTISNSNANNLKVQSISDMITIDKYEITVSKGNLNKTQEVDANTNEVVFNDLEVGDWTVEIIAVDTEGYNAYGGSHTSTVMADTITTANVELYLLDGNLNTSVTIPAGLNVVAGQVKLISNISEEDNIIKNLTIKGSTGTANFTEVKAKKWDIEVSLFDDNDTVVASGRNQIDILPSRDNNASITIETSTGGLDITINVNLSPSDPTGLNAELQNGEIVLNWDENLESNISGYMVYRSNNLDGVKEVINDNLVIENTYTDSNVEIGNTYYYWLIAYDSNGYSSDFSNVATIDMPLVEMVTVLAGTTSADNGDLTLDYDIEMGKYEVTNKEYVEFLNSAGVSPDGSYENQEVIDMDSDYCQISYDGSNFYVKYWTDSSGTAIDISDYPVVEVTWYGAVAYCNWLSEQEGLTPAYNLSEWELINTDKSTLEGYRLPTENEWEYTARGGVNGEATTYAGSNNIDEVAWYRGNSDIEGSSNFSIGMGTLSIGQKKANELNIYDMSGNVWEMTDSIDSLDSRRIFVRGGGSTNYSSRCEVTYSDTFYKSNSGYPQGFRITRTKI
ncbi:hypothetical protein U472_11465 [Orenia metallireducens]|uniref:Fibronectin type-III domain-containing protein n=1 Tax=Orenia metallireducens TaxID=1413210 RepID=A0A1C0A8N4_9FIRM|nr:SUMF1/EgtB/PvdO family nonheme iron enzyme [Orenia metallireducens]OCL26595.1 hypothetical protein U472_11465 [Orenia metallireducens]